MNRTRTFYAFASTQAFSILGSRMSGIAIGFAVYADTGRTAPLLLFSFFNELPAMLVGTLAGAFVDRWDTKKVLVFSDAGQALGSLALVLAFVSGGFEPWILYTVGLWQGLCAAFQSPAKDLLTTRLVPDEGRDRANALLSLSFPAAGILAPGLAGALYPLVGVAGVVAVDLGSFLAAVLAILALELPSRAESAAAGATGTVNEAGATGTVIEAEAAGTVNEAGATGTVIETEATGTAREARSTGTVIAGLKEAAAFLRRRPALGLLILYSAAMNFLLNGPLELALPYSLERTGSEEAAGLALSLQGFGGLAGSALLALRGRARSRRASIALGLSGAGLLMIALALSRSAFLIGVALFGIIACLQVWSRFTSIYQAEAPLELQGRITAFAGQLGFLGSTASFAIAGPLVDRFLEPAAASGWGGVAWLASAFGRRRGAGMGFLLAASGAAILLITLLFGLASVKRRLPGRYWYSKLRGSAKTERDN